MLRKMHYSPWQIQQHQLSESCVSPASSLETKTSSPSEWEAQHSRVGQNSSLLGCTPCARARHVLGIPFLLHSCVLQRWCQQEALHCGSRGMEEGSAGPEERNGLSSTCPAQGEMPKLSSPPRTSPAGDEGFQRPLEAQLLHPSSHRHCVWGQGLDMALHLPHQTLV